MAKLYYWKYIDLSSVGHLSLEITDSDGTVTYLSFWPSETPRKMINSVTGTFIKDLKTDIDLEEKEPDETIEIPADYININKVMDFIEGIKKQGAEYMFLDSNCAQMVQSALFEGGLYYPVFEEFRILNDLSQSMYYFIRLWRYFGLKIPGFKRTSIKPSDIVEWVYSYLRVKKPSNLSSQTVYYVDVFREAWGIIFSLFVFIMDIKIFRWLNLLSGELLLYIYYTVLILCALAIQFSKGNFHTILVLFLGIIFELDMISVKWIIFVVFVIVLLRIFLKNK